jgi:hypothetical protein
MMDFSKNDLSKAQKGDQLWNYFEQRWETVEDVNPEHEYPIAFEGGNSCDFKGREVTDDVVPTYFWDEIYFDIPERPKRMVKKTLEIVVCHCDGEIVWAVDKNKSSAQVCDEYRRQGCIIEELSKEIEIEE